VTRKEFLRNKKVKWWTLLPKSK